VQTAIGGFGMLKTAFKRGEWVYSKRGRKAHIITAFVDGHGGPMARVQCSNAFLVADLIRATQTRDVCVRCFTESKQA
jgi:hypothetical protein